jgi:hypothetical protein
MIQFIQHLGSLIPGDVVLAGVGVILEAALRLIPSQKPLSILYLVDDSCKALGEFLGKLGAAMDHVLPQRTVAPAIEAPKA